MATQAISKKKTAWWMEPRVLGILEKLFSNSLLMATAAMVLIFAIIGRERNYFTFDNLVNVLIQMTVLGFLTWSMAVAMLGGNIDYSTWGVSGFASILTGVMFMQRGWDAIPTIIFVALASTILGFLSSILVVNFRIPGLVATIAVNGFYIAIAMYLCDNYQINIRRPELEQLFLGFRPLGIPFSVWLMFIFFGITWVMLTHTKLGAHIYATGANPAAARLAGVRTGWTIRFTLMFSAACVALAAIIYTTRSGITMLYGSSGGLQPVLGPVVLGGISIFGGSGKIENMLVAVVFTTVLTNGLYLMNASTGVIFMTSGLVFLLALMMSSVRDWFTRMKA
jgi:ribose transport system permease protein